jgi:hypothetical protein
MISHLSLPMSANFENDFSQHLLVASASLALLVTPAIFPQNTIAKLYYIWSYIWYNTCIYTFRYIYIQLLAIQMSNSLLRRCILERFPLVDLPQSFKTLVCRFYWILFASFVLRNWRGTWRRFPKTYIACISWIRKWNTHMIEANRLITNF